MLVEKRSVLKNAGLFLSARGTIPNNFKSEILTTKIPDISLTPEPPLNQQYLIHLNAQRNELTNYH